jgi:hypothetical protein
MKISKEQLSKLNLIFLSLGREEKFKLNTKKQYFILKEETEEFLFLENINNNLIFKLNKNYLEFLILEIKKHNVYGIKTFLLLENQIFSKEYIMFLDLISKTEKISDLLNIDNTEILSKIVINENLLLSAFNKKSYKKLIDTFLSML